MEGPGLLHASEVIGGGHRRVVAARRLLVDLAVGAGNPASGILIDVLEEPLASQTVDLVIIDGGALRDDPIGPRLQLVEHLEFVLELCRVDATKLPLALWEREEDANARNIARELQRFLQELDGLPVQVLRAA